MFLKNATSSYFSISISGINRFIAPGEVISVADEAAEEKDTKRLIECGSFEVVGETTGKKAVAKQAEAAKPEETAAIPVVAVSQKTQASTTVVSCCATTASGKKCTGTVTVNYSEYDADKPYFCGRHKNEKAADYERINGEWVKKFNPSK